MYSPSGHRSLAAEAVQTDLEMGYTLKEFETVLQGGFSQAGSGFVLEPAGSSRWQISIPTHSTRITLTATPAPPRILGAFSLPVLHVSFVFEPPAPETRQRFFERFNRYFHKGGG